MKVYDSYKNSGLKWIGDIPKHWTVSSIRYNANVIGRIGYRGYTVEDIVSEGEGAISLSPSNIQNQTFDLKKRTYISFEKYEESPEIKIFEGDVLLVKTASVGKVAYVTNLNGEKATINPQLVVFKDISINSRFFYYYLISNDFQYQIHRDNYGGVVGTLTQASINSYRILIPTEEEQTQIVTFLDSKTSIIDSIIEKKKRLIELLKEKRQAVINEAVTKGLNANAPMKDSGVEWLGEIPVHWVVKKVKYLLSSENGIKIGPFGSALKLDTLTDKGIKIYGQGNVIKEDFTLGHRYLDPERFEKDFKQYEILDGDILITMMGTTGKSKVFNSSYEKGILDSHLLRLRFNENLFDGRLFSILLEQSDYVYQQLTMNSVGSIMAGLNSSIVKELSIITPTLEIQKEILNYIDENCKIIDSLASKILFQMEKLQSYRQSLISEVVTGKIDVRDWQSNTKKA